jgi:c-di-GMP-binding flagellar brake protein YcgR
LTSRNGQDRRGAARARMHALAARVEQVSEVVVVSTGGMAVRLPEPLEIGTHHDFTVELDGTDLDVTAVVRNSRVDGDGFHEVGFEFVGLDPEQARRIEEFVAERQARS